MHEPPAQFEDLNGCSQYCMITYKPFIRLMGYTLLYYTVQAGSPSVAAKTRKENFSHQVCLIVSTTWTGNPQVLPALIQFSSAIHKNWLQNQNGN